MQSVLLRLQQSIYEALAGDTPLNAALGGSRIYDCPPRDAVFPYVTIDQISARDWSSSSGAGFEHTVTLSVWSRYAGKREVYAAIDAIHGCLHEAELDVCGASLVNLRFEMSSIGREDDGTTHHGVIRFRAVTEQNEEQRQ
jgi:hypothetical protein